MDLMKLKNTIPMVYNYEINAPLELVFNQICNLSDIYNQMSTAHDYFKVRDGESLKGDSIIDCEETVEGEHVKHTYIMKEFEENSYIYYVSDSVTTLPSGMKAKSKVHCYFSLSVENDDKTKVEMGVIIQFSNYINLLFGKLFGTRRVWKPHQIEENLNLARIIEQSLNKIK